MSTEPRPLFRVDPAEVSGDMMEISLSEEANVRLAQEAEVEILAMNEVGVIEVFRRIQRSIYKALEEKGIQPTGSRCPHIMTNPMARTDEADVEVVASRIILGVVDKLMKAGVLSVSRSDEVGSK